MANTAILLVEDEAIIAADLASKLGFLGYEVVGTARNGDDAVKMACRLKPQLVLMDIQLEGEKDGIETTKAILRQLDVPVIYLTAHTDAATLERIKPTNPYGVIMKPFEERDISTTIEMALYKYRTDRQLRNNEERLVAVMDNLTEGLVIANAEGLILYWNPAAIAMHGYASMDECRRKLDEFPDTFELRPLDDDYPLPVADWPLNRVLRGEVLRDFEMLVRRLDQGWEKVVVCCGSLIKSASGEMLAFLSITDITDRKRAEEKLRQATRRFQTIFDHAPVAIYIKNREGQFVMGNRRLEHYTGLPVERLLGMTDYDFSPKEEADRWRKNDLKILEGERMEFEETGIDRDGRPYVNISVKFPLPDESGTPVEVCGISTDITERKAAKDALCKTYAEMEAQVAERTRELREKDQILIMQSRQAAMGEMLGNIAHQWRQPLNNVGIIMQTLTYMHDAGELSRENLVAMENQVMGLVMHMSRTIDDFRNFFRPDKEKVAFPVRQAVEKSVALVEASFKVNGKFIAIRINMEKDPVITGFQNEYSQVLLNILHNARDAFETRKVDDPKVAITVKEVKGRSVVLIPTLNGLGFPDYFEQVS